MTTQYITVDQVIERMPSAYNGSDNVALGDILTSCCAFLDTYCNVANGGFIAQTYDELYHGTGDSLMFLKNRPIQSISRIATTQLPALSITNTSSDMGTIATVQVVGTPGNPFNLNSQYTSTGILLTYTNSAVTTSHTLTWTSYPTVGQLATAINAIGSNWTATVQGGFANRSSSELRATQGSFGARITTCYLWIHWYDLSWYRVNENTGEIWSPQGFARGVFNWRVIYSAGFTEFPDDLTQALAELTVATYYMKNVNPNLQSQSIGQWAYTVAAKKFDCLSLVSQKTINAYRRYPIGHFSTW